MRRLALPSLLCALALAVACSAPQTSKAPAAPARAVPPEIAAAARRLLGTDSEVLAFGDLAHDGRQQALVINRLGPPAKESRGDILFRRASVIEKRGATWREVLRCDEYLKNSRGYLAGTPLAPVTGWRLRLQRGTDGRTPELYFTPLAGRATAHPRTIGVRWNARASRYQSVDTTGKHFLAEAPSLVIPTSELR